MKLVVGALLAAGYIRESDPRDNSGPRRPGPRAKVLSFRSEFGHVLGLDIGANKILRSSLTSMDRSSLPNGGTAPTLGTSKAFWERLLRLLTARSAALVSAPKS